MLGSQDFSCGGGVCCGNVVSGLTAAPTLAPVSLLAVEAASAVCWGLQRSWQLCWRRPLKGLQRSVGYDIAGGCGSVGGGSSVNGRLATAMVSAAVALAETFVLVV